ncbi:lanthionine synthetase C family protein [Actinoplanes sp. TBRC 11911]|uniref:lanthionine synthetase C family protein n=1 Tax=Actinoplanes sp. TBRC 11911 TaxID=2729386 RepID=UPI00145CE25D|nr:lanthionine synthetase C family protein [Actinoplanes sp. TBRC 11911]NMO51809.1 lanthionine synthetase C family protein [Actinoplanes sp. TBRC 11911]
MDGRVVDWAYATRVRPGRRWRPVLDGARRRDAIDVALEVAGRIAQPARLAAAVARYNSHARERGVAPWQAHAIAHGDAGLAVMCAYLDACFPGAGWDRRGHEFLASAAHAVEQPPAVPPSLFGGMAGVAFAGMTLSRGGTRYSRLQATLDEALTPMARRLVMALGGPDRGTAFDVISGAGGVAAYLIGRPGDVLPGLLGGLVALAEPATIPRWATLPTTTDSRLGREYPQGYLDCGLAHGAPGVLALLAIALAHGIEVPGQAEAVRRFGSSILGYATSDVYGMTWPQAVPLDGEVPPVAPISRSAWCYGSPGVARALHLAGEAVDDTDLRNAAATALHDFLRRVNAAQPADSSTFCHGLAGVLQVVLRFAHDAQAGGPAESTASAVADLLLAQYSPGRLLGYGPLSGQDIEDPGLLDGAAGVVMTLLAAATDTEPTWDRLFLLS